MNKFIVGLVLGIAIAGGLAVYLNNAPTPFLNKQLVSTANNSSGTLILQPGTTIKSSASADDGDVSTPSAPKNNASEGNYDFYDVLQSQKAVNDKPANTNQKPASSVAPATRTVFFIQAGAFSSVDLASNMKARLALLGVDSTIKSQTSGSNTINRVLVGPFTNEQSAQKVINQLSDGQISASLITVNK